MKIKRFKFKIKSFRFLALAAANCWTGGGSTNNWSEAANWSLGVIATFGSASCALGLTKNVTIDTNIDLSGSGGGILI